MRYRCAGSYTLQNTHTLPNTFPSNNLLRVIIYSLSSNLFPSTLHTPAGTRIHPWCVSVGRDFTFFGNKFQCCRREVIVLRLPLDTVGVFVLPTLPAVYMMLKWMFPLDTTMLAQGQLTWKPFSTNRHSDRQTSQAGRRQEWKCNIHQVIPPVSLYYLLRLNQLCHHPQSNRLSLERSQKVGVRNI